MRQYLSTFTTTHLAFFFKSLIMLAKKDFAIPIAAVATLSQICRFGGWESSFVSPSRPELFHCSVFARCRYDDDDDDDNDDDDGTTGFRIKRSRNRICSYELARPPPPSPPSPPPNPFHLARYHR
ncbi:hypothetical protein M0804_000727 [Polistes exclamans]|nr:hypothetical protein M0804_000727 [Polistes exclamans]